MIPSTKSSRQIFTDLKGPLSERGPKELVGLVQRCPSLPWEGSFTQAHELGHYLLHRSARECFECTEGDLLNWSLDDQDMEAQADVFASYLLMPLHDYRH
jgi:IrrE N-terminal-like domain